MSTKTNILLTLLTCQTLLFADTFKDQDLDGVPDHLDSCPNTPFLNQVDAKGCTTTILALPSETESDSATFVFSYGFNTNDDLEDRERMYTTKVQMSYYHDMWSYSLQAGYYDYKKGHGILDTTLKIKKRFTLSPHVKMKLGAGVKLPTYDFQGNNTDYSLYSSLSYYPSTKLSYFSGFHYTFIQDEEISEPLHDSYGAYLGSGYFFTPKLYMNFTYSLTKIKFQKEHNVQFVSSTLYYKINEQFYTTFSYGREIDDDDLHDNLNIKLGCKLW